jgi:hypothetical protein
LEREDNLMDGPQQHRPSQALALQAKSTLSAEKDVAGLRRALPASNDNSLRHSGGRYLPNQRRLANKGAPMESERYSHPAVIRGLAIKGGASYAV